MRSTGVLARVLPRADDRSLAPLIALEQAAGADPDPVRRLAAIASPDDAATLRLSRSQLQRLIRMREEAQSTTSIAELGYRYGDEGGLHETLLRCAFLEQPRSEDLRRDLHAGAAARFPVRARDLIPNFTGPALGKKLAELEKRWIASGFSLSREELLAH